VSLGFSRLSKIVRLFLAGASLETGGGNALKREIRPETTQSLSEARSPGAHRSGEDIEQ